MENIIKSFDLSFALNLYNNISYFLKLVESKSCINRKHYDVFGHCATCIGYCIGHKTKLDYIITSSSYFSHKIAGDFYSAIGLSYNDCKKFDKIIHGNKINILNFQADCLLLSKLILADINCFFLNIWNNAQYGESYIINALLMFFFDTKLTLKDIESIVYNTNIYQETFKEFPNVFNYLYYHFNYNECEKLIVAEHKKLDDLIEYDDDEIYYDDEDCCDNEDYYILNDDEEKSYNTIYN